MKVYIVRLHDEMKIFTVRPENEEAFLQQYQGCILAEGNSVQEVLIEFGRLMNEQSRQ